MGNCPNQCDPLDPDRELAYSLVKTKIVTQIFNQMIRMGKSIRHIWVKCTAYQGNMEQRLPLCTYLGFI